MSEFSTITLSREAPLARITLRRPDRLNALSPTLLQELATAARQVGSADGVKVVIISGEGRAFSAGFDVDSVGAEVNAEHVDLGRLMAEAVSAIPVLTIAAIHGHCVGGGLVLAAACDLRVAARSTRFVIPEVDFGIPLAWGGIPRLVREIGPALTKELVLGCRPFSAQEAQALRFVNRVVEDDALEASVQALAEEMAAKPEFLIRQTKAHVDAVLEEAFPTGQSFRDAQITMAALHDDESRAAMGAYLKARGR